MSKADAAFEITDVSEPWNGRIKGLTYITLHTGDKLWTAPITKRNKATPEFTIIEIEFANHKLNEIDPGFYVQLRLDSAQHSDLKNISHLYL